MCSKIFRDCNFDLYHSHINLDFLHFRRLRVFDYRVPKKRKRWQRSGTCSISRGFLICTPPQKLPGLSIKKNEMGGLCGTYGGERRGG
jgi:hypothetical protein